MTRYEIAEVYTASSPFPYHRHAMCEACTVATAYEREIKISVVTWAGQMVHRRGIRVAVAREYLWRRRRTWSWAAGAWSDAASMYQRRVAGKVPSAAP